MAIIFFEGFETLGPDVGIANNTAMRLRLQKRMGVFNNLGDMQTSNQFLAIGDEGVGFAWHMGTEPQSFANTISFLLPTQLAVETNTATPLITMGCLVHIPSSPRTFPLFTMTHTGANEPNLLVDNSTDLIFRVGTTVVATALGVLDAGEYNYVEFQIVVDGTEGQIGTSTINEDITDTFIIDPGAADIVDIDISAPAFYEPLWDSTVTYTITNTVRWQGSEYEALNPGGANLGQEPGVEMGGFWNLVGVEQNNTITSVPNGSTFHFLNDPNRTIYTVTSTDTTTNIVFTPGLTAASYLPANTEQVVFGTRAQFEARVASQRVMGELGLLTMDAGVRETLQEIEYGATSSDTGTNFVAYDDLYVTTPDGTGNDGFLNAVRVINLPPTTATQEQWEQSEVAANNADLVREHGVNETTFLRSNDNTYVDIMEHGQVISEGSALAVKIETEVENLTAGNPQVRARLHLGGSNVETNSPVIVSGDTIVTQAFIPQQPGGGDWDVASLNASLIQIQMFSGFGVL